MNKKSLLFPLLLLTLSSCQNNVALNSKVFYFDTMIETRLFQGNKSNIDDIKKILLKVDALADKYKNRDFSNVYTLNKTNDEVEIDQDLYELLSFSVDVQSKGASLFNPLAGILSDKWKESLKNGQILDENTINDELFKISTSKIEFLGNNIVKRIGEAEIDLGGIAKGYALDKVKSYLGEQGINKYLVNAGSSSILLGEKDSKDKLFNVGIKDVPNAYFKLNNCFVSASGISEQGVTISGVTYSHIINPVTGSAINENDAVVIVTNEGYYGDALSTSLMMNTVDEIKQIEKTYNIKTIVVKNHKVTYCNEGLTVYYH